MNTRFLQRLLPQKQRGLLLTGLLLIVVGLSIAGLWGPELRELAISTLDHGMPAHA